MVKKLFKNDNGDPFEMTAGQIRLFRSIYEKQHPRVQFECYTQYGKSDTVSMAVLLRATTFGEKWIILGGTKDKAEIIMGKLIKHIFENDYTLGKFQIEDSETLEAIKRHKSKDHVSFKVDESGNMGEVLILSADAKKKDKDAGDILIGHGGKNLIEDDAALIPDAIHAKAMRMLGGHKDNFFLKITNSFGRNHAYRSSAIAEYDKKNEPRPSDYMSDAGYKVIKIDWRQGVEESRITPDYIEEMRGVMSPVMFGTLYECVYPPGDLVEDGDWIPLFTEEAIDEAQQRKVMAVGVKRLGADIAEGTNYNSFVIRQDNYAKVREKTLEKDLMKTAERLEEIRREEHIASNETFVDGIGVGSGVVSRCHQLNSPVNSVKTGDSPTEKKAKDLIADPIEFANLRAELNWKAKLWIEQGGALEPHVDWKQACKMRYKTNGGKSIQIMSKEMMRARGLLDPTESPDSWEAFYLTFAQKSVKIVPIAVASTPAMPYYGDSDIPY